MVKSPASFVWMDGKFVKWQNATVHVFTHALHYGSAIFEGMRCYDTIHGPAVFRMKDHFHRFANGIKAYEFHMNYSVSELCSATKKLIKKNKFNSCYLRPICFAGYKGVGLSYADAPFQTSIIAVPFGNLYGKKSSNGIACTVSSWKRVNSVILSPHVKASANYLNSALAKLEAINGGYDEAIMLSEEGHVSEGTGENLFLVADGELITPPLYDGILAGLTRESLLSIAKELGFVVRERSILRDELYTADEVFFTGTAAELTPVLVIDKRKISNGPGKITKQLSDAFSAVTSAKDERFVKWLDFVNEK